MVDPMQWLRDQIAAEHRRGLTIEHSPDNRRSNPDAVPVAAREIYARCESHTAILDHAERYGVPVVEIDSQFDGDFSGKTFVALRAQELVRAVGIAYRHNPGYDEFVDALAAPEVKMQLSDIARADELAARRNQDRSQP